MADGTLRAMARGGMYDQLAGGFARYSVDRGWVVPHFEKMLYDNAQLLGVYTRWWRQTGDPLGERVARQTADFLLAELRTDEGGFASALDADTEGVEGRFYVWTPGAAASRCSGPTTAPGRPSCFEVTEAGTFEHGTSTLQLLRRPRRPGALGVACAAGCSRPGAPGRGPPGTTRWWPPGTVWRSRRSPRPGCCWASSGTSTRRSTRAG